MERNIGGIKEMVGLPDALFVIDIGQEKIAVQEARKLKIPVIGIVDTINDPEQVDYVIPGNDDAMSAISLYLNAVVQAIQEAKIVKKKAPKAAPKKKAVKKTKKEEA